MSRFPTLLLIVLCALTAFQTWQTYQLRQDVTRAVKGVNAVTERASELNAKSLILSKQKFQEAAKAAAAGDMEKAKKLASEAAALAGKDSLLQREEARKGLQFLQDQLKRVYNPDKKDNGAK